MYKPRTTPRPLQALLATLPLLGACSKADRHAEGPVRTPRTDIPDMTASGFDKSCLTAGCHAKLAQTRWVHGPTAIGACTKCHPLDGPRDQHQFLPMPSTSETCLDCHDAEDGAGSLHAPYASAQCLDCHDPHGGPRKDLLLTETTGALCATCHAGTAEAASHAPVATGQCDTCHSPHTSDQPALLKRPKEELCCSCHGEFRELLPESFIDKGTLTHVHEALLEEGCGACHSGHGGDLPALLSLSVQDTCRNCHEQLFDDIGSAHTVHGAFEGDDACIDCHSPHASLFDNLLIAQGAELCLGCHDEPLTRSDGSEIANIYATLTTSAHLHRPAAEGDCAACHKAHYSSERALLTSDYPAGIYADIAGASYDLCFECHDRSLVEDELSRSTGFRDGDRNLHFVHVNREKGRACDICHASHGSQNKALVRDEFRFGPGRWPLPIEFVPTANGGSCASACHDKRAYDRTRGSYFDTTLDSAAR